MRDLNDNFRSLEGENRWRHEAGGGAGWEMLEEGESSPDANNKNGRGIDGGASSVGAASSTHENDSFQR